MKARYIALGAFIAQPYVADAMALFQKLWSSQTQLSPTERLQKALVPPAHQSFINVQEILRAINDGADITAINFDTAHETVAPYEDLNALLGNFLHPFFTTESGAHIDALQKLIPHMTQVQKNNNLLDCFRVKFPTQDDNSIYGVQSYCFAQKLAEVLVRAGAQLDTSDGKSTCQEYAQESGRLKIFEQLQKLAGAV